MNEVAQLLHSLGHGDPHAASWLLAPVYGELRQVATQARAQAAPT
jgi:hypothetical protein